MLNEREIYVLGKVAVDEIRELYYQGIETDMIFKHPRTFVAHLEIMIAKLQRVKDFAVDYQKAREKQDEDESE